jgi:hypothetical protein
LFGEEIAQLVRDQAEACARLEKASAPPEPYAHARRVEAIRKSCMAATGPGGGEVLARVAQARGFPTMSDDLARARENRMFSNELTKLRGTPAHPAVQNMIEKFMHNSSPGVGERVRMTKAVNDSGANSPYLSGVDRRAPAVFDRHLPGYKGPTISSEAVELINCLPDGRQRNSALNALLVRPPANPNDYYKWRQSVVEIIDYIRRMCGDSGKPLIDSLAERIGEDGEISYYQPTTQDAPPTHHAPGTNVGPSATNPSAWPSELRPPQTPIDPGPFSNSGGNSDYMSPDFKVAKTALFQKFADVSKRSGRADRVKNWWLDEGQRQQYARMLVDSEFRGAIKHQIAAIADDRDNLTKGEWKRLKAAPIYKSLKSAIEGLKNNSWAMKGALLELISEPA